MIRPSLRAPPARLAFAAVWALVVAPDAAIAAAPLADAPPTDFCGAVVPRLADAGEQMGYRIQFDGPGFSAARGASELRCICLDDLVVIDLADDDANVSVSFARGRSVFALELAATFPELGSIRHTWTLDGSEDRLTGALTFAADTPDDAAFVEFDLEGDVSAADGDAALLNERFAPVLTASSVWRDAHAWALALADLRAPDLDVTMTVAVPTPRWWGVKKSMIGQAFTCGGAAITCTAAAAGFMPAAGSCVQAAGGCALAVACSLVSCLD